MISEKGSTSEILERLFSSYGVTSQKELAERLGIAPNNISGWTKRGSVSGNAIIKCALDTGADLHWLVTGEFENSHLQTDARALKGKPLYDQILASGGKAVLRRMMDAYGFSTQKELGDLLGISTATISTWIRRDFFPGDVVIACALDTGVSLEWLATGKGKATEHRESDNTTLLKKFDISSGELYESGLFAIDKSFCVGLSANSGFLEKDQIMWLVDFDESSLSNGTCLINIDGIHDVYSVVRVPGNFVKLSNSYADFECSVNDIDCVGKIRKTILVN
ncbi:MULTISPECIES: phage repressor protein CI [Pectobacterium]|uniref:phage repressor protein CI n=1 Tax=Pectobacterium TaxID=122277 RepID=UPI001F377EBA|nr:MULTISPECIES: phage repressor protein CI [Pectobacterium]MCE9732250.1 repressor [Pectobacterium sp. IFB5596]